MTQSNSRNRKAELLARLGAVLEKGQLKLEVTDYDLSFSNLPSEFDGLKMALITDLHGSEVPGLADEIRKQNPDLIILGGDFFDGIQHADVSLSLLASFPDSIPVYGISGNHEMYRKNWPELQQQTAQRVCWLENREVILNKGNSQIRLAGLSDPGNTYKKLNEEKFAEFEQRMENFPASDLFTIALIHRPQLAETVNRSDFDLILSGHTHGGQWRIFHHGLAGPGLTGRIDLFPKYDGGLYDLKNSGSKLIVSRGLGDQMWIPRINNRPELVMITLHSRQLSN